MKCPSCYEDNNRVISKDAMRSYMTPANYRIRLCLSCRKFFTTSEVVVERDLRMRRKDRSIRAKTR